jgi:flagellar assembly protein FliH
MSSKILSKTDQPCVAPVPWRIVTSIGEGHARNRTRNDAETEAARQVEQARRDGFGEGVAAGQFQAEQQVRPSLDGIARSIAELARMRDVIRQEATRDLVQLAVSIAARVIHRDVAMDPDALAGLVTAAFTKLQTRELHRVRMHPGMEAMVQKSMEQVGSPRNVVLSPDPALKPGELFFETSQGALDASVDTQLREIERGLIDKLER